MELTVQQVVIAVTAMLQLLRQLLRCQQILIITNHIA